MKKIILMTLWFTFVLNISAVSIELMDNLKMKCEIVGKQVDTLFVAYNDHLYKVHKEDIRFINAQHWSGNQKSLFFEKKDWMNSSVNPLMAKNYIVSKFDYSDMVKPATLKNINEMNDREFQMYLAQTQAQAIKDSSKKITRTMWMIVLLNVALAITIAVME